MDFIVMNEKEYESIYNAYKILSESPFTSDELLKELNEFFERIAIEN